MIRAENKWHMETEANLEEMKERINNLEKDVHSSSEEQNMHKVIEQLIKDKQLITQSELARYEQKMHAMLQESQVKLLKWIVGTGISTIGAITAIIRLFY